MKHVPVWLLLLLCAWPAQAEVRFTMEESGAVCVELSGSDRGPSDPDVFCCAAGSNRVPVESDGGWSCACKAGYSEGTSGSCEADSGSGGPGGGGGTPPGGGGGAGGSTPGATCLDTFQDCVADNQVAFNQCLIDWGWRAFEQCYVHQTYPDGTTFDANPWEQIDDFLQLCWDNIWFVNCADTWGKNCVDAWMDGERPGVYDGMRMAPSGGEAGTGGFKIDFEIDGGVRQVSGYRQGCKLQRDQADNVCMTAKQTCDRNKRKGASS
jgi:hypothetical protein